MTNAFTGFPLIGSVVALSSLIGGINYVHQKVIDGGKMSQSRDDEISNPRFVVDA